MARGLFAVLEDEMVADPIVADSEQDERIEELESQVAEAEMNDAGDVIDNADETLNDATTGIDELNDIAEVASDSIEKGEGLTEEAAEIAEVAIEAICARLGYKPAKKIVPAMESFGGASSRLDATKYVLEGIKEASSKAWEAIKAFFSGLFATFKAFWDKMFDASLKIQARAKSLGEKSAKARVDGLVLDGDKKFKAGKYCIAFNTTPDQIASDASKTVIHHVAVIKTINNVNTDLGKLLESVEKAESSEGFADAISAAFEKIAKDDKLAFGYEIKTTGGDLSLPQTKDKQPDGEVTGGDIATLEKICRNVVDQGKAVAEAKKNIGAAETVIKKIVALADKLSKKENAGEEAKTQTKKFRTVQTAIVLVNKKIPGLAIQASSEDRKSVV